MVREHAPADTSGVQVETLSPDLVRTVDAIELPPVGSEVLARAERSDAYPIFVTRSPEETIERLLQAIGEAHVDGFECSIEVVGSDGTLKIRAPHGHVAQDNIERHGSAYREELRHFVECLDGGEEPCVSGEDAIAALRLALMAEQSVG